MAVFTPLFAQHGHDVRLDWGAGAVAALSGEVGVFVVIDVLSFSTRVDLSLADGVPVRPVDWDAEEADAADEPGVVTLRSPNGASTSVAAATSAVVLTACLRNATAVAEAALVFAAGAPVAVVPAGERWGVHLGAPVGTPGPLRPCVEDHLGAGAVVAALLDLGAGRPSAEASLAALAFRAAGDSVGGLVAESVSGKELREHGDAAVVERACEVGCSPAAPVLDGGVFRDA